MSWDLICLKAHEHRQEGDETYACLYKNLSRIEKENINALQYNVRVVPLPLVAGNGDNKQLVTMEEALFKVIVDLNESKVMFDIGGADAAETDGGAELVADSKDDSGEAGEAADADVGQDAEAAEEGLPLVQLYDMEADPYQTHNLRDACPEVVHQMDHCLAEWLHEQSVKPYAIPDPMQVVLRERQDRT